MNASAPTLLERTGVAGPSAVRPPVAVRPDGPATLLDPPRSRCAQCCAVGSRPDIRTIRVTNKREGAAIRGRHFSVRHAAQVMGNSGLCASIKPLARIGMGAGLSPVILVSYRGELGESIQCAIPHGVTMEPVACRD